MAHQWRFFRSGGFDQVKLDRVEDWQHLGDLDPKLWAALSCPVKGLEFDERTMAYLDFDKDGRVRIDEVKAAVAWALSVLKQPEVLLSGHELPIAAIDVMTEEGKKLAASARRILKNLGKEDSKSLSVSDTQDLSKIFPADQLNGDGVITPMLSSNEAVNQLVNAVITCGFSTPDRSGEKGINQANLDAFCADAGAYSTWKQARESVSTVLGDDTENAYELVMALNQKVSDYFTRCALAAYDANALEKLNGAADDFALLSRQLLDNTSVNAAHLPLAKISIAGQLPLRSGVHPHWAKKLQDLSDLASGLWKNAESISATQWQQLTEAIKPFSDWKASEPKSAVTSLTPECLDVCLAKVTLEEAYALMESDLMQKAEAESVLDVDKLVRYQANLRRLLRNFVNLENFYNLEKSSIFQNGRLYIDGRSCDLCIEVNDAGKHAKIAGMSGTYLLYMDCVRHANGEKKSVVAAVTAGDSGNLMVGRNGVFYDVEGTDWDATVNRIVENPISIREAFFTPYRRVGRMISEQVQKFAASKDKDIEAKSASSVGEAASKVEAGAKPTAPAPFDVAKFAGIFAAIGLAIGAIGTALAAVVTGFLGLLWWQMPLALIGVIVLISGPSMLLAWFKLRKRNLAPLLDANGWAVNSNAKISIKFGTRLTALAEIPDGSSRTMTDPFEPKSKTGRLISLLLVVLAAWWLWREGYLIQWFS